MSTTQKLGQAIESLEAALQVAEKERDQGVFELARGVRSHGELMHLAERVALVRSLVVQARTLLPPMRHRSTKASSALVSTGNGAAFSTASNPVR